jgi:hypothetical protein
VQAFGFWPRQYIGFPVPRSIKCRQLALVFPRAPLQHELRVRAAGTGWQQNATALRRNVGPATSLRSSLCARSATVAAAGISCASISMLLMSCDLVFLEIKGKTGPNCIAKHKVSCLQHSYHSQSTDINLHRFPITTKLHLYCLRQHHYAF